MPDIIITTSRRPGKRLRSFIKDLATVLPAAERVTRGHLTMEELAVLALNRGVNRVVVVAERRGNPGIIRVYEPLTGPPRLDNIVSFIVKGVALSREKQVPQPKRVDTLAVKVLDEGLAEEIGEAMLLAFNAKLLCRGNYCIEAILEEKIPGVVTVRFVMNDREVGPTVKLAKTAVMVKKQGVTSRNARG